jgi:hypothetical protein
METAMIVIGSSAIGSIAAAFTWECIKIRTGSAIGKILTPLDDEWFQQEAKRLMALPEAEREAQMAAMGRGVAASVRMLQMQPA